MSTLMGEVSQRSVGQSKNNCRVCCSSAKQVTRPLLYFTTGVSVLSPGVCSGLLTQKLFESSPLSVAIPIDSLIAFTAAIAKFSIMIVFSETAPGNFLELCRKDINQSPIRGVLGFVVNVIFATAVSLTYTRVNTQSLIQGGHFARSINSTISNAIADGLESEYVYWISFTSSLIANLPCFLVVNRLFFTETIAFIDLVKQRISRNVESNRLLASINNEDENSSQRLVSRVIGLSLTSFSIVGFSGLGEVAVQMALKWTDNIAIAGIISAIAMVSAVALLYLSVNPLGEVLGNVLYGKIHRSQLLKHEQFALIVATILCILGSTAMFYLNWKIALQSLWLAGIGAGASFLFEIRSMVTLCLKVFDPNNSAMLDGSAASDVSIAGIPADESV